MKIKYSTLGLVLLLPFVILGFVVGCVSVAVQAGYADALKRLVNWCYRIGK